ncbi:MAG: xanthine dehydrogenase [Dethiosulfovibrio peptidovorans]|nr:MAG: xanthine dehydrogenase [Dethiosulfovibrio peptidovorans]
MDKNILHNMRLALNGENTGVLCTVVGKNGSTPCRVGSKMWVAPDGSITGTVGGGDLERQTIARALELLRKGIPHDLLSYHMEPDTEHPEGLICGGATSLFLEVMGRRREVVIFGAGHVGHSVGTLASFCGYGVTFWDDREDITSPPLEGAKFISIPLPQAIQELRLEQGVSVVICTWAHGKDGDVVRLLEGTNPSYIGMLSSKTKGATLWGRLRREGVSETHLKRIHTPIGLSIGAGSPQEIAVSIMAEIISVDSGRTPESCCPST